MSEAKEKDRILAQINAFKPHNEIEGLSKHLYDLEQDGYISVWYDTEKNPITLRLTEQGGRFLDSGGYAEIERKKYKEYSYKFIIKVFSWIFGIAATVIGGWIVWKLTSSTVGL